MLSLTLLGSFKHKKFKSFEGLIGYQSSWLQTTMKPFLSKHSLVTVTFHVQMELMVELKLDLYEVNYDVS